MITVNVETPIRTRVAMGAMRQGDFGVIVESPYSKHLGSKVLCIGPPTHKCVIEIDNPHDWWSHPFSDRVIVELYENLDVKMS